MTCSISVGTWHTIAISEPAATKDPNKEQETAARRGETYDCLFVCSFVCLFFATYRLTHHARCLLVSCNGVFCRCHRSTGAVHARKREGNPGRN